MPGRLGDGQSQWLTATERERLSPHLQMRVSLWYSLCIGPTKAGLRLPSSPPLFPSLPDRLVLTSSL